MLRQLSQEHCTELSLIFRRVEETGEIPVQWTVSIVAMLAKTPQIERPIALLHVVYKAFVKLRWDLVEKWLADVARDALGRGSPGAGNHGCFFAPPGVRRSAQGSRQTPHHHFPGHLNVL